MLSLHSFCAYPFTKLQIYADGGVNMCCYQTEYLGNLLEQPLEEIWFGARARAVRAKTLQGELHAMCKGWGGCPFLTSGRKVRRSQLAHEWPSFVELALPNTHCNIGGTEPTPDSACFMCPRSAKDFAPHVDRTAELVSRVKPMMPYLEQLAIVGLAEPFWKGAALDVLEQLEFPKHGERCMFSTFTNASVLTPERQKRLFGLCPRAFIQVSIDAASAGTYREVRRLDLFDRVLGNVESYVRLRGPGQSIHIVNNINMRNLHECAEMVRLAKRLGVERVGFNPTHDGGVPRPELEPFLVNPRNAHLFRRAQQEILEEAARIGMDAYFWRDLDLGIEPEARAAPGPAEAAL